MNRNISFALNQIIAPNSSLKEFVFLSKKLGIETIEIRNDVATNLINENKPYKLRDFCEKNFLKILTINALQKFNLWNNDRLNELRKLCKFASSAGIQAIVLVPLNDGAINDIIEQRNLLKHSLKEIVQILNDFNVLGYVEPLGFQSSSLRSKSMVIEEIEKLQTSRLKIVHDTFHHFVAEEKEIFPSHTGLVHISGVSNQFKNIELNDNHRSVIEATDIINNINQIRNFLESDYEGFFSFEPFAKDLSGNKNLLDIIRKNFKYIEDNLKK